MQVHEALLVAPISTSEASSVPTAETNLASAFVHAGTAGRRLTTVTPATVLQFEAFRDVKSPREFLQKVEKVCVVADISREDHVRRVIVASVDGSA